MTATYAGVETSVRLDPRDRLPDVRFEEVADGRVQAWGARPAADVVMP
jgi:hypothetical protein